MLDECKNLIFGFARPQSDGKCLGNSEVSSKEKGNLKWKKVDRFDHQGKCS